MIFVVSIGFILMMLVMLGALGKIIVEDIIIPFLIVAGIIIGIALLITIFKKIANSDTNDNYYNTEKKNHDDYWCE